MSLLLHKILKSTSQSNLLFMMVPIWIVASEKVEICLKFRIKWLIFNCLYLSVLCRHENIDDGVGAGAQVNQNVSQQEPEMVRWISNNLEIVSHWRIKILL